MRRLLWIAAAGFAGYLGARRLQGKERAVRPELVREGVEREQAAGGAAPVVSSPPKEPTPVEASSSLEERVLRRITETPGILQTELYPLFPEESRRILQETLRNMERKGDLRRAREGGTYRLFLA